MIAYIIREFTAQIYRRITIILKVDFENMKIAYKRIERYTYYEMTHYFLTADYDFFVP